MKTTSEMYSNWVKKRKRKDCRDSMNAFLETHQEGLCLKEVFQDIYYELHLLNKMFEKYLKD